MNTVRTTRVIHSLPIPWMLLAGLWAASADLTVAAVYWAPQGLRPERLLQSVASWTLGNDALAGGAVTAAYGALFYWCAMSLFASAYRLASHACPKLLRRPILCGALYGALVYGLVFNVLLPLFSASPSYSEPHGEWELVCLLTFSTLIGIPFAVFARLAASDV